MGDSIKVNKYTKELKSKKRLNSKKLEREEEVKNRFDILEAGQEDRTKAIKAIQQEQKEAKIAKDKVDADALTDLQGKKKFHEGYKASLARALSNLLEGLDWISGWQAYCMVTNGSPITIKGKGFSTKDGILLIVVTADGRVFHQGILVTREPILDYSALYTMAVQTENQMDKERGLLLDGSQDKAVEEKEGILDQYGSPIKAD